MDLLLERIKPDTTTEEKLRALLEVWFGRQSESLSKALYFCSVPHWFDLDFIQVLDFGDPEINLEEIYNAISKMPFVEEYPQLGYALNSSIRDTLLDLMWNEDQSRYVDFSNSIAKHLQHIIARETLRLRETKDNLLIKKLERLIFEYRQELTYHLLIADEVEGIKCLNELLAAHLLEKRSSQFQSLLRTVSEHGMAGRLSDNVKMWIHFWETYQSQDLNRLEELRTSISSIPIRNESPIQALEGCLYYTLSNLEARRGNSPKAWIYFYKAREFMFHTQSDLIKGCVLCEANKPIDLENPTPSDLLWLGLNLPNEPSRELFGRNQELDQLGYWLEDRSQPPISVIYGLGGMGKTALAHATAKYALRKRLVENVLWTSAKNETFVLDRTECMPDRSDFQGFLWSAISSLLNVKSNVTHRPPSEEITRLAEFFNEHKLLIVIDNVDSLADANCLAEYLPRILGNSKAIITGRFRVDVHNAWALKLHGLDESDSVSLLEWNVQNLSIPSPGLHYWRFIHKMTAGSPLVMKLLVSQLANESSERVLLNLLEGKGEIYRYIYGNVLRLLSSFAKKLLGFISASSVPVKRSNIEKQTKFSKPEFNTALAELEKAALIETSTNIEEEDAVYMTDTLTSTHLQRVSTP
jgi:NB-ARC domain